MKGAPRRTITDIAQRLLGIEAEVADVMMTFKNVTGLDASIDQQGQVQEAHQNLMDAVDLLISAARS